MVDQFLNKKMLSDNTASIVDEEIRRIADSVYSDAQKMLKEIF